jgi:hypothetical protein
VGRRSPGAEHVAHTLGQAMAGKYVPATPLTTRRHRSAQAVVKARKAAVQQAATSTAARQQPSGRVPGPSWTCPDCGGLVSDHRHVRCDPCIAADPRQTPKLRATRAAAIAARRQTEAAWAEATGGASLDPDQFASMILPALSAVKLSVIVAACGVSKATASSWRAGKTRPHPSHWKSLTELLEAVASLT